MELGDNGKDYAGHGAAFLRRAKSLGVLGGSELSQRSDAEEEKRTLHTVQRVKVSLADAAAEIDKELDDLQVLIIKRTPIQIRLDLYQGINSIRATWSCYHERQRMEKIIL